MLLLSPEFGLSDGRYRSTSRWRPGMLLALLLVIGAINGCEHKAADDAPELTVLVAASTIDVMTEFAEKYEQSTGVHVNIAAGPSNGLARQIIAGAPADVYVSASPEWADLLAEKGLVARTRTLCLNSLVLIVPRDNPARVESLADLRDPRVKRLALAGENVPAGEYAEELLRDRGLWEPLRSAGKIIRGHDVRVTLGYVERGEVAAGIVYATDALASDRVIKASRLNDTWQPTIRYPVVLLKGAAAEAEAMYEALLSAGHSDLFTRHGFTPVAMPASSATSRTEESP